MLQVQIRYEQKEHQSTSQDDKCKRNPRGNPDDNGQESQDNKLHRP